MRTTLSLIAALLAGVLAVLATAGALLHEAAHRPEMVRSVTEQAAADPDVRAALPGAVTDVVGDAVPDAIPDPARQWAEDLVRPLAQRVADDPQVAQGWSDTADEARRAWLAHLDDPDGADAPGSGGDVMVPFGPVAQSGIAAALGDIERDLRENRMNVPGQWILEKAVGVDVGDWAADTLIKPLYDRAAALRDSSALRMTVHVDALGDTDRATVNRWVDASAHWRWAAAGAVLALAGALVLAPRRRRGLALVVAGAVTLAGGLIGGARLGADAVRFAAPEGAAPGVATFVQRAEEAVRPALAAAVAPYPQTLTTVAWVTLGVGLLVMLAELMTGRVGPRGRVRAGR
ncbi:hypothetical protein NNL26_08520 [Micrococcus luteus]|uniref:hypothetical protein n=1 Tax=Micrococcus luteus TaxID=1270 RepID=UPI002101E276|nr:hypothetical protein [Micrococcus luteus]UTX34019.1 hypothetical protein NNL26_08520 [Micrococcus luteus]